MFRSKIMVTPEKKAESKQKLAIRKTISHNMRIAEQLCADIQNGMVDHFCNEYISELRYCVNINKNDLLTCVIDGRGRNCRNLINQNAKKDKYNHNWMVPGYKEEGDRICPYFLLGENDPEAERTWANIAKKTWQQYWEEHSEELNNDLAGPG